MKSDSLERGFTTYQRLRESLEVALRAIEVGDPKLIEGTEFAGKPITRSRALISETRMMIDDLVLIGLWAFFEREIIEYTQSRASALQTVLPEVFAKPLHEKVSSEVERWRVDDLLDLFKGFVDPDQLGRAKQIKDYRDWIAHRNPRRKKAVQAPPDVAYAVFLAILSALD